MGRAGGGTGTGSGAGTGIGAGRALLRCLTGLTAAGALVLAGPGTAEADGVPGVAPTKVSGVARTEIASVCSGRPQKTVGFAIGELRIYKARDYACALTVAKDPGPRRTMTVSLQARGARPVVDSGNFVQQAGPVTVHALNRCVRVSGAVAGVSASTGWILC
ncbi:hypothetical protein [Streptomyces sp. NPDC057617]|uniref:hypothetical protein n=1 Tax=Streptomyces sp. NPDC057617 TaxID=3346184 RepID=UPI0036A16A1E